MRVTVTRHGGFAGIALRGTADTADFPGSEQALRGCIGRGVGPPQPDAFVYDVAFDSQNVSLNEREIPDALRLLLDRALADGQIV